MFATKDQLELKNYYRHKEYQKALSYLKTADWAKKDENRLLVLMERGRILYAQKFYKESAKVFEEAQILIDQQYTKKISDKFAVVLLNENSDTFNGNLHEISMLYYYQAMDFLMLYHEGVSREVLEEKIKERELSSQERSQYLHKARAVLLAWDSFFTDIKNSTDKLTAFEGDLLGKVLAANVHELIGRSDLQIALQLYKDGLDLLEKNAGLMPSFATNSQDLAKYFFALRSREEMARPEVSYTQHYRDMQDYLKYKIIALTKKLRGNTYKNLVKKLNVSKDIVAKVIEQNRGVAVNIFIEEGALNGIYAQKIEYSLNSALEGIKDPTKRSLVQNIGIPVLTYFALGPLGLGYMSYSNRGSYYYVGHDVGTTLVSHVGIEFEIPAADSKISAPSYELVIKDNQQKEVHVSNLPLLSPVNDILSQYMKEKASSLYTIKGLRVATKYALAILAAYTTYKSMKGDENPFARMTTMGQFLVSSKAIAASESADIRHWVTLPANIYTQELYLLEGSYSLTLRKKVDQKNQDISLGIITVKGKERNIFTLSL